MLQPHQQRVIDEKIELDKKARALSNFIGLSDTFETLDTAEQYRLRRQCEVMWEYSETLLARIVSFDGVLVITKSHLEAALRLWEIDAREGKTLSHAQADALPVEEVAASSADRLWQGLIDATT